MMQANVTYKDGSTETLYFSGMISLTVWYERHREELSVFASKQIAVGDMRQGRDGGNEGHDDGIRG